ncbi:hypothetical protein [Bradyrhizobium sp.]|uniref:hypothetical protein n=1 Tax=Bradyrhizobium sp. TaxID=376 RepID=UPI002CA69B4D|nr:hypothetical protein [Bradyrhizobium sp.]HMM88339.1 hypothetical protein [Bradyrhizobium sp.]
MVIVMESQGRHAAKIPVASRGVQRNACVDHPYFSGAVRQQRSSGAGEPDNSPAPSHNTIELVVIKSQQKVYRQVGYLVGSGT